MAKSKKSVNVIKPVPALCEPELQTIHFHSDEFNLNDPNIIYQPSCTRVKKCGGCCNSPLLSCQSLQSSITNFEVMVFKHEIKENENSKIVFQGNYIIPVEIDTKCKCACTIKEKDCTQRQSYDPMRCKCFCKNWQDEDKCGENISEGKTWNPSTCECSFD
ncbi:hypothetical protein HCN44_004235 [Aphidius gifuensis]|uniref:Platelet-derived growth factor (PDGF) family profile domain-containing protein n=1 Tax=Aphidius gifuensis TaxID=684658 RepID=A0A834XYT1_APHGI|nr:hypothetical protein HCN44_004235 [Aphidius gifuensis]